MPSTKEARTRRIRKQGTRKPRAKAKAALEKPNPIDPIPRQYLKDCESWADFYERLMEARKIWPQVAPILDRIGASVMAELGGDLHPPDLSEFEEEPCPCRCAVA